MCTTDIKREAHKLIEALPDDATWDDLMYSIYVRASVEAGLADADAGCIIGVENLRESYGLQR